MAKRVKIPGRLESAETGNIVTGADAVIDDAKGKTQAVINSEVNAAIINLAQGKQDNLTFDSAPTEDSPNPVTSAGVYTADKVLSDAIEAILLLIPSAASALNKLVDMQTMNSSIATATASFKGTYNLVSDLHLGVDATHEQIGAALDALSLGADNNDYAFVQVPNSATAPTEISKTERYKFNGENWLFEYDLNNSGFTQGQWNAINSGVTSLLVGKLSDLPTNTELTALLAGKQDNLTFDNVPTAGSPNPVKSGGVYARNNEIVALINALDVAKQDVLTFDNAPVEGSPNPVESGGVYTAISAVQAAIVALDAAKQKVLTFDSTPTLGSPNPVTSSGIKTELNRIDGNITTLNDLYEALTQSALVIVQPTDTWPVANPEEQTIYRVVDRVNTPPQYYSDYMWNGTAMVMMAEYDNAIDPRPKKASQNLVTSGGVFDNMGALDVSELNSTENPHTLAQYVDLSAALAAIPIDYQKGGMSIKFVQSSDDKYVQYRLMNQNFTTTESDWQGVDAIPTVGSHSLVESDGVVEFVDNLRKNIISIVSVTFNQGRYIGVNGAYSPHTDQRYRATEEYTDVKFCNQLVLNLPARDNISLVCFYNEDKVTLSNVVLEDNGVATVHYIPIPQNAAYARFSGWADNDEWLKCYVGIIFDYKMPSVVDKLAYLLNKRYEVTTTETFSDFYGTYYKGGKVSVSAAVDNPEKIGLVIYHGTTYEPVVWINAGKSFSTILTQDATKIRLAKLSPSQNEIGFTLTIEGTIFTSVDRIEDIEESVNSKYYYGKKLVTIGDSYSAGGKWQNKLSQIKGFDFNFEINKRYNVAGTPTLFPNGEFGQLRAKSLVKDSLITPDVIILENVNDSNFISRAGTSSDEPYFIGEMQTLSISPLATQSAAEEYFNTNINTILSGVTPEHGYRVSIPFDGYGNATLMTFNSAPTQNGYIRISYGIIFERYINVESTDTISDVIEKIMEFAWTRYTVQEYSNGVKFSPTSSGSMDVTIIANTTGMNISLSYNQSSMLYVVKTYPSHNMTNFLNPSYWVNIASITLYSAYKGLFNYLSANFPNAEIFWMAPIAYSVDVNNSSFQFADGTLDTDKVLATVQFTELKAIQKQICQYCKIPLWDLEEYAAIYPQNVAQYFPANNYHPNDEGYNRWGIACAKFLL